MAKRHLPPNHPALAKATLAYGKVLAERGSYDQAITALDEAVRLQSAPGVAPADLANSLSALADDALPRRSLRYLQILVHSRPRDAPPDLW